MRIRICGTVEKQFLKNRFLASLCLDLDLTIGFHKQMSVCVAHPPFGTVLRLRSFKYT